MLVLSDHYVTYTPRFFRVSAVRLLDCQEEQLSECTCPRYIVGCEVVLAINFLLMFNLVNFVRHP